MIKQEVNVGKNNENSRINHTFVICAYKESKYLEKCIQSLFNQTVKSEILLATSTPNTYISHLCDKYHIPCYINEGEKGITQDWNFAYSKANTKYITIAHQDDIYESNYTEVMYEMMEKEKKPLIFFSDYFEIRDGKKIRSNNLLRVKRILLFPLQWNCTQKSKIIRRISLGFGCAICCPSVTFATENIGEPIFQHHFRTNEDWEAWEKLSKLTGSFIYSNKQLMGHRIHEESETSAMIRERGRYEEDLEMFQKFWPKFIAKFLAKLYGNSEKSNLLKN